jgi:protease IV
MQQFFKFVFASCLGVILASIVIFFLGMGLIGGLAASSDDKTKAVKDNSILELKLESEIPELTDNVSDGSNPFDDKKVTGLQAMVQALDHAATDNKIKGILINTRYMSAGFATMSSLRRAIQEFKQKSGKFVFAYGDMFSQGGYYVASVADKIMINPSGAMDFAGLSAEIPFMKDLFSRLNVDWQIYYAGQFKSATEPLRLDKMSDANRLQTREYIDGLYNIFINDISKSRNIEPNALKDIANGYKIRRATDAVTFKMVDTEGYYDQMLGMIRTQLGLKDKDKINSISLQDYTESYTKPSNSAKDKIAVVYAEGSVDYGNSEEVDGTIQGERYSKIIRKLRQDKTIKAIVLRVNSGGGSAFASDLIWRELTLARQQGIPVVTSFGDVAASGGYYIAMASDSIFAEPNTITGSIGVFVTVPGMQNTFKNKLGITFDTVRTGRYSAMSGVTINFDNEEGRILQEGVDTLYERFLNIVATNRRMTRDQVHAVAQGRVWLGDKAKEIGLVDKIGSLDDAIKAAAAKANLTAYKTSSYPKSKEGIQKFIESITGQKPTDDMAKAAIKRELGEFSIYYDYFQQMRSMKGPQMRIPMVVRMK